MNEIKLYIYNAQEVIAVFDSTEGEIVTPENTQQKIATEEEAFAFFEQEGIIVPEQFKNREVGEEESFTQDIDFVMEEDQ